MKNINSKPIRFTGSFFIKANHSLSKTTEIINGCLNLNLEEDLSGYYEEFPAFSGATLNVQMVLLGIPKKEFIMEGENIEFYNFQIMDNNKHLECETVNLGTNFISLLRQKTELTCLEDIN